MVWWRVKTGIRKATTKDIPALVETLSLAFEKDPVMDWIIRDDDKRTTALKRFFTHFLKESIPYGETNTTDEMEACAVWVPPGVWAKPPPLLEYLRTLPELLRWTGLGRLKRYIDVDMIEYAKKPTMPHYYLVFLGVKPEHQGNGFGSQLLEHTLSWLDETGLPAYLENSNKENLSLYERHGFKVYDEFKLKNGTLTEWCMLRKPKTLIG
jgi:GNAT superfamily N-acetyltransferase